MTDFDFGEGFKASKNRVADAEKSRKDHAKKGVPFQIGFIDDIAKCILPTDLVVVGAATGAGKTTLGLLLAQQSAERGSRVHHFALEAYVGEMEERMVYRAMAQLAYKDRHPGAPSFSFLNWQVGRCEEISEKYYNAAVGMLESCGAHQINTFYRRSGTFGVNDLVKQIAAIRCESDLVIVDHLHFIDSDDRDDNRGMKQIVKAISDAVNETKTPVVAISHLRKKFGGRPQVIPTIDDFHGSSDITKIATRVIIIAPARDHAPLKPYFAPTYISVAKDRLAGNSGLVALVNFDMRSNSYEKTYRLGRVSFDGATWEPITEMPVWAESAI